MQHFDRTEAHQIHSVEKACERLPVWQESRKSRPRVRQSSRQRHVGHPGSRSIMCMNLKIRKCGLYSLMPSKQLGRHNGHDP